MTDAVVNVHNIGKRYKIGVTKQPGQPMLREAMAGLFAKPITQLRSVLRRVGARPPGGSDPSRRAQTSPDHIWALRGVSFAVTHGEVLGIIGRNGAGKSTLLKILSRITEPTEGRVGLRGRIASLLEVGTGFHPELTGRENIFLNGTILGMRRTDIARNFDAIVAFSELERFLDTPVKHYSSGMYMRLAFAVAAHLESEILLVDEVLAVGDAAFQAKCLGKMKDASYRGRTILFVSHNLAAVAALCKRAILLESGGVLRDGPAAEIAALYQARSLPPATSSHDLTNASRLGTGKAQFTSLNIAAVSSTGHPLPLATTGCDLVLHVTVRSIVACEHANLAVIVSDANGYRVIDANTAMKGQFLSLHAGQSARARLHLRNVLLRPGTYFISLWLGRGGVEEIDYIERAAMCTFCQDPHLSQHSEVFPGVYVCDFQHEVDISP